MQNMTKVASLVLAALLLAGCGNSAPAQSEESSASGSLDKVTMGVVQLVDVAPVYLGKQKGFFADQGIDLVLEVAQGGAAIIPAVTSGQMDFGFSNPTSLILARSKGLPVKVVAPGGSSTGEEGNDYGAVVVPEGSELRTAADLSDRTVAVNTLQNIGDTSIKEAVRAAGGDPDDVNFVEMPFPNMQAALDTKQVDAMFVVEPFLTTALNEGSQPIAWNWIDVSPNLMASAFFTTDQKLQSDPDLVKRFKAAMETSAEYAQDHPDEARTIIASYTSIPPDVLADITLPRWEPAVDKPSLQRLIDLAHSDGLISETISIEELLAEK